MADSLTTECGICNERYGDGLHMPRVLHSGPADCWKHTFCSQCLTQHLKDGQIKCAFCREDIDVMNGVDKLSVDADCFAQMSCQELSWTDKLCTLCDNPADIVCHPCGFCICRTCKDGHEQFRKRTGHKYIDIQMMTQDEKDTFKERILCKLDDHDLYVIDRYCLECKVIGCPNCMDKDHSDHKTTSITDALATKKEQLTKHLEHKEEVEKKLAQNKRRRDVLKQREDESFTVIETTFGKLREVLTCKEDKCKATIKDSSKHERTKLEDTIRVLNTLKDLNDSSEQYITDGSKISTVKRIAFMDVMESTMGKFKDILLMLNTREMDRKTAEFEPQEDIHSELKRWLDNAIDSSWKGASLFKEPALPSQANEICILVLGKPKSSRGKTCHFLMKNDWKSDSETRKRPGCKVWTHNREDTLYRLVYTPGITNIQAKGGPKREALDIAHLTTQGPHVLLVVVKNPDEDVSFLHDYRAMFSTDITPHLIVVFTGKLDLDKRHVTIQIYVQNRKGALKNLVEATDNRYIACNPYDKTDEVRFRDELMAMVKKLDLRNEHAFVTLKN